MFHPWLLHLDKSDLLPGQIILPSPPIWFDKENSLREYIAEEILDSRIDKRKKDSISSKKRCLIYKIKFTGQNKWNANPD